MLKIRIKRLKRNYILDNRLLKKIINKTLKSQGIGEGEISLLIVGDSKIRMLNRKYLNRKTATDVLAFNMQEGRRPKCCDKVLGDIVISVDRAKVQAKIFKNTLKRELALYVIHGLLHLVGYKDGSKKMEKLQQKILSELII